ncbi:MAG: hypothetical protein GY809_09785, partial [Planctomycetes bacterium]|nr:hypothetical protein [Planctomycetota bacterium]
VAMQPPTGQMAADNNLLITGNVGGAKHFRGSVPYRASSALQAPMPSDSLSTFFRLSQQQNLRTSSPLAYTPYFSATGTATHTQVGQPGIITPATFSQMSPARHMMRHPRPLVLGLTPPDAVTVQETLEEPRRHNTDENWADGLSEGVSLPFGASALFQLPVTLMQMDVVLTQDVNVAPKNSANTDPLIQSADVNDLDRLQSEPRPYQATQDPNGPEMLTGSAQVMTSKITMQAYAHTKFNTFMKAGEQHLKAGEYAKAADAYSLASVYHSGHALAEAGRSHALMARRAYSTSALHLIRALNGLPDYAKTNMGLSELVGGPKALKGHIDRLESCTEDQPVPELKLLLAFAYVQVRDLGLAQEVLQDVPPDSSYEIARGALLTASRSVMP